MRVRLAAVAFFLFASQVSGLQLCYDPYPGLCCNGFEVDAQLLWVCPTFGDEPFFIEDPNNPSTLTADSLPRGELRGLKRSYRFGYRLGVARLFCDRSRDVTLQYSALRGRRTRFSRPPQEVVFWPAEGHPFGINLPLWDGSSLDPPGLPALAHGIDRVEFYSAQIQLALRERLCCEHLYVRMATALHIVYLDHSLRSHYTGFSSFTLIGAGSVLVANKSISRSWGVGPGVVADGRLRLPCGFGLSLHLAAGLIAGGAESSFRQRTLLFAPGGEEPDVEAFIRVRVPLRTHLLPLLEGRTGLCWGITSDDCFSVNLELGIEWDTYVNALVRPQFNHTAGTSSMEAHNFCLRGLYIAFRFMS